MSWMDNILRRVSGRGARADRPSAPVRAPLSGLLQAAPWTRADTGPPDFPRFRSTAGDQIDPRRADAFSAARVKLRRAFTPSQPITDRQMFAGRTAAMSAIIRAIEDQKLHVVIHGERGVGKTSALNVLTQAAREARYLVIYVSCGAGSTFDDVFRAVSLQIPLMYHSAYGPTDPAAERGGTVADLLPEGTVSTRLAGDILSKIVGTRILVILDEFDRAESAPFRTAMGELMKDLSDRSVRVQLVIAGVAANLTELLEHIPSIQRNVFALQLSTMSSEEIRALVAKGSESSGLTFEPGAVEQVETLSVGFPYRASLVSHHAGLTALDDQRLTVTQDDVEGAGESAMAELKGRVSRRSQLQIQDAISHSALAPLGALAATALATGGNFNAEDVAQIPGSAADHDTRVKLLLSLAAEAVLIQGAEEEYGRRYHFIEQGVPAYLWLLSERARTANGPTLF
jgi:Cdc6-like AAA superfamily ATPase